MTGSYFENEREAKLLVYKQNLQTATLKLEDIEAQLHDKPNWFAKCVLLVRKYRWSDIKLEAEGRIEEMDY